MANLDIKIRNKIDNDQDFRISLAQKDLEWFANIYFPHYITFSTADFQTRIYEVLEGEKRFVEILAFRESAKSTIAMLIYPIWCIVTGRKKFILLLSDTGAQIKLHIESLIFELENNKLLNKDFGAFQGQEEWTKTDLTIPNYGAKIIARSTGQKIRGSKFRQYRPDLIVADDIENVESVRTLEGRKKTLRWFAGEVIPALGKGGKVILIGNLLHRDCLMTKVKEQLRGGLRDGILLEFPLLKNDAIVWLGKYPNMDAIEEKKKEVNDIIVWQREYLLRIVAEEGQTIKDDWIQYYDEIPLGTTFAATGVDLAISKKDTANYTAMVSGKIGKIVDNTHIFIMPYPVNERLSGLETTQRAKEVSLKLGDNNLTKLWVEDVAYQKMQIEVMRKEKLPVEGVKVSTDKRARLIVVSPYIEDGTVLFPRVGCEDLIAQLLGFGIESNDDLVDAFTILISKIMTGIVADTLPAGGEEKDETILGNVMKKDF